MAGGHDELYSGKRDVLATLRVIGLARNRHLERIGQGATVNFANEFTVAPPLLRTCATAFGLLARSTVVDALRECLVRLLDGEQRSSLEPNEPRGRYGQRHGRRVDIVGHVENHNDVVVTESVIEGFNLASQRLQGIEHRLLPARSFVLLQTPQTFSGIGRLDQILGHSGLLPPWKEMMFLPAKTKHLFLCSPVHFGTWAVS